MCKYKNFVSWTSLQDIKALEAASFFYSFIHLSFIIWILTIGHSVLNLQLTFFLHIFVWWGNIVCFSYLVWRYG
jgi:hypothetical protein